MNAQGTGKETMFLPSETSQARSAQRKSLPQMMSVIGARLRALSTDEGDNGSVAETLLGKPGERFLPCI